MWYIVASPSCTTYHWGSFIVLQMMLPKAIAVRGTARHPGRMAFNRFGVCKYLKKVAEGQEILSLKYSLQGAM